MITSVSEFHAVVQALQNGTSSPLTIAVCDTDDETLAETLCAFANMPRGGAVLILLPQHRSSRSGAAMALETIEADIQSLAQHRISPAVPVQFFQASFEGERMVVVNIPAPDASVLPHRLTTTHQAYVRAEYGNHPLSTAEIQQLQGAQHATPHDRETVSGTGREHLDDALIQEFVDAVRRNSELLHQASDADILRAKGVVTSDGELTIAGLYALGRYPQQFFPNLRITAELKTTDHDTDARQQRFDGPLPVMLEDAVRWLLRHAGESGHQSKSRSSSIPIVAIREIITNALVHRDLSPHAVEQSVHVAMHDDQLTVTSPGGVHNISLDQLGREPRETAVNTSLYEMCRFVSVTGGHPITEPGRHTLRHVHWALRRAGLYAPTYINAGLDFTVVIGRRYALTAADQQWLATLPSHDTLTTQQRYLLISMSTGKQWNADALQRDYGPAGAASAFRQLGRLADLGLVHVRENFTATSYRIDDAWLRSDTERFGGAIEFQPSSADAPIGERVQLTDAPQEDPQRTTDDDSAARAAAASKHGATLWNVLGDETKNIHDIAQAASLSLSQTRYGIQRLVLEGIVDRKGGQGHRETLYRRATN